MVAARLSIDIQNDCFEGGRFALPGARAAADRAAQVLDRFRRAQRPVVQVQHVWDTTLRDLARELEVDAWVFVGMRTNLCVDSSVRAAADLGWEVTVVGDACAACDLDHGGRAVCAADVHAAFLAALDGNVATVVAATGLER